MLLIAALLALTGCPTNGKPGGFKVLTEAIPPPVAGAPYSLQLQVSKNQDKSNWAVVSGSLPDGMTLSATGLVSGTPTVTGNWSVVIRAKQGGSSDKRRYEIAVRVKPGWTIIVLLDGDHNLERHLFRIMDQLEDVGSSDNVNIIAQLDRIDGYDSTEGDWTDTRRYYIRYEPLVGIQSPLIGAPGELDMSNGTTFVEFVTWAADLLPADRYALAIYDHGGGWRGGMIDDTSSGLMNSGVFADSLEAISAHLGGRIDLLILDECLMADVEVCAIVAPSADWLVASERYIHNGFNYTDPLTLLAADPSMTAADLANAFVTDYHSFTTFSGDATLSAIDLSLVEGVTFDLDYFFGLIGTTEPDLALFSRAIIGADGFSPYSRDTFNLRPSEYVDLYDFALIVAETSSNAQVIQAALDLANSVVDCVGAYSNRTMTENMRGVTFYFPGEFSVYSSEMDDFNALFNITGLSGATWNGYFQGFYAERENLLVPVFSNFNMLENVCDISSGTEIEFAMNASNGRVWCIDARYVLDNNVWWSERHVLTRTISGGREVLAGGWTNTNTFTWSGETWALDNGTATARFTTTWDQKKKGIIQGTYVGGTLAGSFTMFFNTVSGNITTFTDESWSFTDAPPEGIYLRPWVLKNTGDGRVDGVHFDAPLYVGAAGITLRKIAVPDGDYGFLIKMRDLTGIVTSVRSATVRVQP